MVHPSHEELVQDICRQVKEGQGRLLSVKKPHADHTPRSVDYKKNCYSVDVTKLTRVLEVNTKEGWMHVEGLVNMDQLVTVALEFGMIPACCPEFRAFTVAGLINGRGVQSSSHKYGLFEVAANMLEVEVVLGDGSVIVCDSKRHADFFHHIGGCYGTLGIVTAAKVRLVPATKMVKCEHHVFDTIGEFTSFMESQLGKPHFLDGVVFSRNHAVAILGDFVQGVPAGDEDKVFHPLYPESPGGMFYYQYVRASTAGKKTYTDYIPTKEYAHRSERGLWWFAENMVIHKQLLSLRGPREQVDKEFAEQYENYGFRSPVLTASEQRRTVVAQDQGFKIDRVEERLKWSIDNIGIFPIWVCYVQLSKEERVGKFEHCTHLTDIGLYGVPSKSSYRSHEVLRAWQLSADEPVAWGELYLKRDEADRIKEFGPKLKALRKQYKAEGAFKDIEDKITLYDPSEEGGPPMAFFRIRLMWRQSKALFLSFCIFYPFMKLACLVAVVIEHLVSLVKLLLPKTNSKSKVL